MHLARHSDAFRLCSLNEVVKMFPTDGLSRLGHNERVKLDGRALHLFVACSGTPHPDKMFKHLLVQHFVHADAACKPLPHFAGVLSHMLKKADIRRGQRKVKIVVPYEWLSIDVHLKVIMRPLRMLVATFMSAQVVRAAGERPFQILVPDGQFDEFAGVFIREVVDVLRKGLLVRDPSQVILKDGPAVQLGETLEMLLAEPLRLEQPMLARLCLIELRQYIATNVT